MLSKDYLAELSRALQKGMQREYRPRRCGMTSTDRTHAAAARCKRMGQGSVKAIDRPRKNNRCAQELRVEVVETFLAGKLQ